jgi:hypothetical protein
MTQTRVSIRVFALLMTTYFAAFLAGCGDDPDPEMIRQVRACVSIFKGGRPMDNVNGTVNVRFYDDSGTKAGQSNRNYGNGAYGGGYYDPGLGGQAGNGDQVSFGVMPDERCPIVNLGRDVAKGAKLDTITITGSSFTDPKSGVDGTADEIKGKAIPKSYNPETKIAEVQLVFDIDNEPQDDAGKLVAKIQRLNRKPGFSGKTAVSDRRVPRPDAAFASGEKRPSGPAGAAI